MRARQYPHARHRLDPSLAVPEAISVTIPAPVLRELGPLLAAHTGPMTPPLRAIRSALLSRALNGNHSPWGSRRLRLSPAVLELLWWYVDDNLRRPLRERVIAGDETARPAYRATLRWMRRYDIGARP